MGDDDRFRAVLRRHRHVICHIARILIPSGECIVVASIRQSGRVAPVVDCLAAFTDRGAVQPGSVIVIPVYAVRADHRCNYHFPCAVVLLLLCISRGEEDLRLLLVEVAAFDHHFVLIHAGIRIQGDAVLILGRSVFAVLYIEIRSVVLIPDDLEDRLCLVGTCDASDLEFIILDDKFSALQDKHTAFAGIVGTGIVTGHIFHDIIHPDLMSVQVQLRRCPIGNADRHRIRKDDIRLKLQGCFFSLNGGKCAGQVAVSRAVYGHDRRLRRCLLIISFLCHQRTGH